MYIRAGFTRMRTACVTARSDWVMSKAPNASPVPGSALSVSGAAQAYPAKASSIPETKITQFRARFIVFLHALNCGSDYATRQELAPLPTSQ
jgi:hypothetical protein